MNWSGSLWWDNAMPIVSGLVAGFAHYQDGGGGICLLAGPAIGWLVWQWWRLIKRSAMEHQRKRPAPQ